jgi:hypothetical protein
LKITGCRKLVIAAASLMSQCAPILQKDNETEKEFGGAVGAAFIMIFSHILPYYLWISNFFYDGRLIHPESL